MGFQIPPATFELDERLDWLITATEYPAFMRDKDRIEPAIP